jgi:hypothetical protein
LTEDDWAAIAAAELTNQRRRWRRGTGRATSGTAAKFQSVNTDGWRSTYASPPTFDPVGNPEYFTVTRQGFNTSGGATTYSEDLVCTQRTRQVYPNQASLETNQVALSDYIYSTDTVLGATNNSTEASPKPVANWVMPDRMTVGNTIHLEVTAFHRNARDFEQIAAVEFRATDGTTTVTQVVATSAISSSYEDAVPVIVYQCDLDISALANPATVTVNAKVYPWIGGAASVLDSADSSVEREFSPRTFTRDTAAQRVAYVRTAALGGNDGTGVVSTVDATASANPFLTHGAAINAMHTHGAAEGVIYTGDDQGLAFVMSSAAIVATRTQNGKALIITRESGVARANARVSFGLAAFRPRLGAAGGYLIFRDMGIVRTGTLSFTGEAASALRLYFDRCNFDNASNNAAILSNSDAYFYGVVFSNLSASLLNAGTREIRTIRGCTIPTSGGALEGWLAVGNLITTMGGVMSVGSRSATGSILSFNKVVGVNATSGFVNLALSADVSQVAIVQNLLEFISATANPAIRGTADAATGNVNHIIIHNNTVTGFFNNGRSNLFYEDGATARTSKLMSVRGNIQDQINTKGDVFVLSGARVGNWAYLYGVGCDGEFSQFIDADSGGIGSAFAQAYPGINASIGTSSTVRNDPLWTTYAGTTSGPTAGAGGGVYTLQSGSPAKARCKPNLRFDLAGSTRTGPLTSSGAYL